MPTQLIEVALLGNQAVADAGVGDDGGDGDGLAGREVEAGLIDGGDDVGRKDWASGRRSVFCREIWGFSGGDGDELLRIVMGEPAVLVDDNGKPIPGLPAASSSSATFHSCKRRHDARLLPHAPEFCGACHRANLPQELNGYKWLRAFTTYDEWQQSSWSRQSPAPFYKKAAVSTCQDLPHASRQ